jgi:hypothetical protein
MGIKIAAHRGWNRKAWRHRDTDARHFMEPGAFATKDLAHLRMSLSFTSAK